METPANYQPIERRKIYELIAEQLLGQIGSRRLKPGDPLPPERELTESFGVGRSSIREALRMLESQGVIAPASAGTFVVAEAANPLNSSLRLVFTLDDRTGLHDLFELRRILDCEAAALAAERRTDDHLAAMDAAVAEATGNRMVLHSMHAVRDVVRRALTAVFAIPRSPERAVVEHRAIRSAIAAGDSVQAREEMRNHLVRVETDVEKGAKDG